MHLSVIVPAYNEEKNLAKNIKKFSEYLSRQPYEYEIIVVNDGSTDKTEKIAAELIGQIKNLRLINNIINKNKTKIVIIFTKKSILTLKMEKKLKIII